MNIKKVAIVLLFTLLLMQPVAVSAATAGDIGNKLICQCGGCSLVIVQCDHQDCSSAEPMHDLARDMAAEGQTEQMILGYFVSTYGAQVLASNQAPPPSQDSGQIAGVAPIIAVVFAGVIIFYVMSKWAGRAKAKR